MTLVDVVPIGTVASATGIPVSAVRYYDEIGLIASATRVGGKRRFHPATVGRVNFIRRAQEAGFTLGEISVLLDDEFGGWRSLVQQKIEELTERRDRLDAMIAMLEEMGRCGCEAVAACPRLVSC